MLECVGSIHVCTVGETLVAGSAAAAALTHVRRVCLSTCTCAYSRQGGRRGDVRLRGTRRGRGPWQDPHRGRGAQERLRHSVHASRRLKRKRVSCVELGALLFLCGFHLLVTNTRRYPFRLDEIYSFFPLPLNWIVAWDLLRGLVCFLF